MKIGRGNFLKVHTLLPVSLLKSELYFIFFSGDI